MGCGCGGGARKRSTGTRPTPASKTLLQVVLNGGEGRTAFQTHNKALADQVARNYPGSIVRPAGAATNPDPPAEAAAT